MNVADRVYPETRSRLTIKWLFNITLDKSTAHFTELHVQQPSMINVNHTFFSQSCYRTSALKRTNNATWKRRFRHEVHRLWSMLLRQTSTAEWQKRSDTTRILTRTLTHRLTHALTTEWDMLERHLQSRFGPKKADYPFMTRRRFRRFLDGGSVNPAG